MFVSCFRCKVISTRNSQQENPEIKKTILITIIKAVSLFQQASNRELFWGIGIRNRRHPRRVRGRGPPHSGGRDSAKRVVSDTDTPKNLYCAISLLEVCSSLFGRSCGSHRVRFRCQVLIEHLRQATQTQYT